MSEEERKDPSNPLENVTENNEKAPTQQKTYMWKVWIHTFFSYWVVRFIFGIALSFLWVFFFSDSKISNSLATFINWLCFIIPIGGAVIAYKRSKERQGKAPWDTFAFKLKKNSDKEVLDYLEPVHNKLLIIPQKIRTAIVGVIIVVVLLFSFQSIFGNTQQDDIPDNIPSLIERIVTENIDKINSLRESIGIQNVRCERIFKVEQIGEDQFSGKTIICIESKLGGPQRVMFTFTYEIIEDLVEVKIDFDSESKIESENEEE